MFLYNEENRPEPKTTRIFRPGHQVAAPGTKSAIADCILCYLKQHHRRCCHQRNVYSIEDNSKQLYKNNGMGIIRLKVI